MTPILPADVSRGHGPLLALMLGNPGRPFTMDELHAHITEANAAAAVAAHIRCAHLVRDPQGRYLPATPFPLSPREGRRESKRRARQAKDGGRDRAAVVRRGIQAKQTEIGQRALTLLADHPEKEFSPQQIGKALKTSMTMLLPALGTLAEDGRVHASLTTSGDANGTFLYRAVPAPAPDRAPRRYTDRHVKAWEIVRRTPRTRRNLTHLIVQACEVQEDQAEKLIADLLNGSKLRQRAVGNTVVFHPGPHPTLRETR